MDKAKILEEARDIIGGVNLFLGILLVFSISVINRVSSLFPKSLMPYSKLIVLSLGALFIFIGLVLVSL